MVVMTKSTTIIAFICDARPKTYVFPVTLPTLVWSGLLYKMLQVVPPTTEIYEWHLSCKGICKEGLS